MDSPKPSFKRAESIFPDSISVDNLTIRLQSYKSVNEKCARADFLGVHPEIFLDNGLFQKLTFLDYCKVHP